MFELLTLAPPARPRTHPARSSPPGRSPASHRSPTDPDPHPASTRSGSQPSHPNRRCSTDGQNRRHPCYRRGRASSCCHPRGSRTCRDPRPAGRPTAARPALTSLPGRSPGCRSSRSSGLLPAWSCSASCLVRLMFSAVASDSTLFDCDTRPPSPLLSTRTGVFELLAPFCAASEAANASCSFFGSWPIARVPPSPTDPDPHPASSVQVCSRRIRIDAVRLTDRAVVTLAVDPHRSVVVRRPELQRSREAPRTARSWPPGRSMDAATVAATALPLAPDLDPHPAWSGSGWQRSRPSRRCSSASRGRVALAVHPHRGVRVARTVLQCERQGSRLLLVLRFLPDRLDAAAAEES